MADSRSAKKEKRRPGIVATCIVAGMLIIAWLFYDADQELRQDVLEEARMVVQVLRSESLGSLTGTESDLSLSAYRRIKDTLAGIRSEKRMCRFIYILGERRDGGIYFLVDSENPESDGYSPPGQTYVETTPSLLRVFQTGQPAVTGPERDHWGTWMSSLVPMRDPQTGALIAVLGMDFDAGVWLMAEIREIALPVGLILLLLALLGFLVQSEVKYRKLIEHANAGVTVHELVVDGSGRAVDAVILTANRSYERHFGLGEKKVLRRRVSEFFPGFAHSPLLAIYEKVVATGKPVNTEHYIAQLDKFFSFNVYSMAGKRFAVIFDDITERKRAEGQLKETNRRLEEETMRAAQLAGRAQAADQAKSTFLANMSHEIRTPMNALLGYAELLAATELTEKQREYLRTISSAGELLLAIINDVLDVSKFETGKILLNPVDFNLRYLCGDIFKLILAKIRSSSLITRIDIAGDVPEAVRGDSMRLRQVLINLLGNAAKFTKKGEIVLSVSRDGEPAEPGYLSLRFSVRDTGIGISREKLDTIFQPFTQGDDSTTRVYGGTGLGLTICRTIIGAMGGRIWVSSELNEGSEFVFVIPLAVACVPTGPAATAEETDRSLIEDLFERRCKGACILIAEDNPVNRDLMQAWMQMMGVRADFVENGREAIERIGQRRYDMCFMDVHMPVMDGLAATREIRAGSFRDLPVVALSASVMQEDREQAYAAGVNDYVTKPVNVIKLKEMMVKWALLGTADGHAKQNS